MLLNREELSVVVERRSSGLKLVIHVPPALVGPAAEMVDAFRRQLGPAGSMEGLAEIAGSLAGLLDGARVTSALATTETPRTAA